MYNIILKFEYGTRIKIPCVELVDLMRMLPVIDKMQYFDDDKQKPFEIKLEPVQMIFEGVSDAESN